MIVPPMSVGKSCFYLPRLSSWDSVLGFHLPIRLSSPSLSQMKLVRISSPVRIRLKFSQCFAKTGTATASRISAEASSQVLQ